MTKLKINFTIFRGWGEDTFSKSLGGLGVGGLFASLGNQGLRKNTLVMLVKGLHRAVKPIISVNLKKVKVNANNGF